MSANRIVGRVTRERGSRLARGCLAALAALATSGCLVTGQGGIPLPGPDEIGPVPVCQAPAQCEAMWAAVEPALRAATNRRIQTRRADFMETTDFSDAGLLYGRAWRRPLPQGGEEIVGEFRCGRPRCAVNEARALQRFQRQVREAGAAY